MIIKSHFAPVVAVTGLLALCIACVAIGAEEADPNAAKNVPLEKLVKIPASTFTKIIDNSTSPDKRFAVAVGSRDGKKPRWSAMPDRDENDAYFETYDMEHNDCRNYVVDLKSDRVTGILDGQHFGTRNRYNHESGRVIWSPDSRWLVEHQNWKWHTETCTVHRLDAEGRLVGHLDFLKAAKDIMDSWLREKFPEVTEEQRGRYAITAGAESISNDGSLKASVSGEIPKGDDTPYPSLKVTAKIKQGAKEEMTLNTTEVKLRE